MIFLLSGLVVLEKILLDRLRFEITRKINIKNKKNAITIIIQKILGPTIIRSIYHGHTFVFNNCPEDLGEKIACY